MQNVLSVYMKDYKSSVLKNQKDEFLNNYLSSLNKIISKIGDKNPISLDITGNEPTFDIKFLQKVLTQLKEENIKIRSKSNRQQMDFI